MRILFFLLLAGSVQAQLPTALPDSVMSSRVYKGNNRYEFLRTNVYGLDALPDIIPVRTIGGVVLVPKLLFSPDSTNNALNRKVNYTDTSSMLSNYRTSINAAMASGSGKMNISDTATMLNAYKTSINAVQTSTNLRLLKTDTATMLSKYVRIGAPYTVTRVFETAYQPNTTRSVRVMYTVQSTVAITLAVGQTSTIYLESSPNNSTWTEEARHVNTNTGTLAVGFSLTQVQANQLTAVIPAGYWVRLRSTGTGTNTIILCREVAQ